MIYASLKPVRLWRHPLTPINYLLLSLTSGLTTVAAAAGEATNALLLALSVAVAVAAVGKLLHFRRVVLPSDTVDINRAVGVYAANTRLLDMGHTAGNFLTREFIYQANNVTIRRARQLTWLLAFALPFALSLVVAILARGHGWLWLASLSMFVGLLAERWLFFAEARHVVRLYHGHPTA